MNSMKEKTAEGCSLDSLLDEVPVEKVDMNKLLRKYVSLLVQTFGEKEAADRLKEIIGDAEERQQIIDEAQNRKMVLLNSRTGVVEMGLPHELKKMGLLDNPGFTDITGRLSEIHIYRSVNPDDPHRLRCKVDGVQQMSVSLTPAQDRYWQGARLHDMTERARYVIAGETYADLLMGKEQQIETSNSVRR